MKYATWEENIASLVAEIAPQEKLKRNFVYGYTDAGILASFAYGNLAVLNMDYYVVVFLEESLLLLEISMAANLTGNYGVISYTDLDSFRVKKGWLQYVLTLKLSGEKQPLRIKCNRKILNAEKMGMGWQIENVEHLAKNQWNGLESRK